MRSVTTPAGYADSAISSWLSDGAPGGVACSVTPGGLFPITPAWQAISKQEVLATYCFTGNRKSFDLSFGESVVPGLVQVRADINRGAIQLCPNISAAEQVVGFCHPSPFGNLRKPREDADGWKD